MDAIANESLVHVRIPKLLFDNKKICFKRFSFQNLKTFKVPVFYCLEKEFNSQIFYQKFSIMIFNKFQ